MNELDSLLAQKKQYESTLYNLNNTSYIQLGLANARNPQSILDNLKKQKEEFQDKLNKVNVDLEKFTVSNIPVVVETKKSNYSGLIIGGIIALLVLR